MQHAQPDLVITEEFAAALDRLTDGDHLFLTGKAGTGKSTLIRHFMATSERVVTVAAPTGIAALNVGGYTIHRLFSFLPSTTIADVRAGRYYPGRFAGLLQKLQTLVIDEASMVRADLFDMVAAALERFGPFPHTPFGGVQLVLVGDLYQLPPVVTDAEEAALTERYGTPYFFSAEAYRAAKVPTIELTHVFRQQGDMALVSILGAVRDGTLLPEARAILNERTDPDFVPPMDEFWVTLTTTNRLAGARNRQALDRLPGREFTALAEVEGDLDGAERPTDTELTFREGAQVMLLSNDPWDRWVNGTIGRITDVRERPEEGQTPRLEPPLVAHAERFAVDVLLPDGSVVEVGPHTWDITRPRWDGESQVHDTVGAFTQLPFRLAWAITVHKSQGQTLDHLVVDLSGGTFADGQLYVALSRATSLAGLVLRRAVEPRHLRVDARVRRFFASLPELSSTASGGVGVQRARGFAYLGVCLVGDSGSRWKPRPIEIAVAFEDGRELSTLVNPTRDLGDARARYGLGAADVQLAPLLTDAWATLAPHLEGLAPVGVDMDVLLGFIDFELKRGGVVSPLPVGVDVADLPGLRAAVEAQPTALGRARAVRAEVADPWKPRLELGERAAFGAPLVEGGYLHPRPEAGVHRFATPTSHADLGDRIRTALTRGPLTTENERVVAALAAALGEELLTVEDSAPASPGRTIGNVMMPGARVCFTGDPVHAGRTWYREDMEDLAIARDLAPVANVTKTRCDALVVAEPGTQSGKARKALQYDTPVFTAAEFFAWADPAASGTATGEHAVNRDVIVEVVLLDGPRARPVAEDTDEAPF